MRRLTINRTQSRDLVYAATDLEGGMRFQSVRRREQESQEWAWARVTAFGIIFAASVAVWALAASKLFDLVGL